MPADKSTKKSLRKRNEKGWLLPETERPPVLMLFTDEEKRYLAGFFDGEGCIVITKSRHKNPHPGPKHGHYNILYRLNVRLPNTNKATIEWLVDRIGGGMFQVIQRGNRKPAWMWFLDGWRAKPMLEMLQPVVFLKRRQCAMALQFLDLWGTRNAEERLRLYTLSQYLNAKGVMHGREMPATVEPLGDMPGMTPEGGRAYLAGFFDAEGSISINQVKKRAYRNGKAFGPYFTSYRLHARIGSTNQAILQWMVSRVGGAVYDHYGKQGPQGNRKPAWTWHLGGESTRAFLETIRPYLRIKQEQMALALEFLSLKSAWLPFARQELYERLITLNMRGITQKE